MRRPPNNSRKFLAPRLCAGIAVGMLNSMEIDPNLAGQALQAALEKYPQFASFGPRLIARPLFQGTAFMLEYERQPPPELADAWDFQNAAVKGYKRLAG